LKQLCEAEGKLITFGPVEQGTFLKRMQAEVRLETLLNSSSDGQKDVLRSSYSMLTSPEQMGQRFKFFAMFPAVLKDHLAKFPASGFHE